ncbi:MAG: hypothetical protein DRI71_01225 [Bacteroidetes bacterium]|nr:MAG: hypothetical protein DRI71_01225 [Bacteroidota bacterium]
MAETLDQKQTHILTLLMLAEADDKDHVNEIRFINNVAGRIGLSVSDVHEIDKHPERLNFSLPESEADRMTVLFDLLFLMKIDGEVAEEEKELVRELGVRLGFRILMIEEFIQTMAKYVGKEVPPSALLDIIRKYMN